MRLGTRNRFAKHWREAVLALAAIAVTYLVLEATYRIYQYHTLPERLFRTAAANFTSENRTSRQIKFDINTGFLYTPFYEGRMGPPWNSHWRTNSHGHVSQFEYPRAKPAGEYRIAVVGDSMTANVNNNVRWTELLEQHLNASPQWRAFVGERFTRVINFGIDATGFTQFAPMLRYQVMDFEPDLILVNFISDDVMRRLRFPTAPAEGVDRDGYVRAYIKSNFIDQINWLELYPELFAAAVGQFWNMRCSLPLDDRRLWQRLPDMHYQFRSEAVPASAAALRDMIAFADAQRRPLLFLQQPELDELDGTASPRGQGLIEELQRAVPEFRYVSMRPRLEALLDGKRRKDRPDLAGMTRAQIVALPDGQRLEIDRWFFVPADAHYTDYGTALYAKEVARYLIERAGS